MTFEEMEYAGGPSEMGGVKNVAIIIGALGLATFVVGCFSDNKAFEGILSGSLIIGSAMAFSIYFSYPEFKVIRALQRNKEILDAGQWNDPFKRTLDHFRKMFGL